MKLGAYGGQALPLLIFRIVVNSSQPLSCGEATSMEEVISQEKTIRPFSTKERPGITGLIPGIFDF